jgi:hypothetical protein
MPKARKSTPKSQQLLVEGTGDRHVIWALCQHHQLPETFSVEVPEEMGGQGIEILLNGLPERLKDPNLQTLGILIDADQDLAGRWQSLRNRLITSGYTNMPKDLPPDGLICAGTDPYLPRIGAWLMPNNRLPGMLEDFVAQLISEDDALLAKAETVLWEIEQAEWNRYTPVHRPKALIHTWLAWQEKPGMPMGQAITAQVLKGDGAIALTFVAWLRQLFA